MTAAADNRLMDEIRDQFLVCKICFELYTRPKTLACLHTFCEACLVKHQDAELERSYRYLLYARRHVSCPICRKKTELPPGGVHRLPDNILVPRLGDIVGRRTAALLAPGAKGVAALCEICRPPIGGSGGGGGGGGGVVACAGVPGSGAQQTEVAVQPAVSKCLDCVKMLCRGCSELHRRTKVSRYLPYIV